MNFLTRLIRSRPYHRPAPIYVFGSNTLGEHDIEPPNIYEVHAMRYYGAIKGVPEGRQGNSYAVPTHLIRQSESHSITRFPITPTRGLTDSFNALFSYIQENPRLTFNVGPLLRCPYSYLTPRSATVLFPKSMKNVIVPEEYAVWRA